MTIEQFCAEMDDISGRFDSESAHEPLEKCKPLVLHDIGQNFERSENADGVPWKPRKNIGDGHPLLLDTHALGEAAAGQGAGHIESVGPRDLTLGVDGSVIEYANIHNEGGETGRPGARFIMPQREYERATETTLDECEEIIADDMLAKFWKDY